MKIVEALEVSQDGEKLVKGHKVSQSYKDNMLVEFRCWVFYCKMSHFKVGRNQNRCMYVD